MDKLKLRLNELKVESFDTLAAGVERGTVAAHMPRPPVQTAAEDTCECTFAPSCKQTNCMCMVTDFCLA
jgi:hypothetical protein